MRLAVVVCFLDEEQHLPTLLASLQRQSRTPDEAVFVDDGSRDRSAELAENFASRYPWARLYRRPPRTAERDRLYRANELRSFQWAVQRLEGWDVVAKLDADLELAPDVVATMERSLDGDPRLGMVGPRLCTLSPNGRPVRHRCPPSHVEGAVKFYRRACYEQIAPLPAILGWDTLDEVRARMCGWRTESVDVQGGATLHLRPMGSHDGMLRGFRRAGVAAYAYGADPVQILLSAAARARERPIALGGITYIAGWALAGLRRERRAEREAREFLRREQRERRRRLLAAGDAE
jgi:biofilm PGA synthesis N-glycosyltransferase PgaC